MTHDKHTDRTAHDDPGATPVILAGAAGTLLVVAVVIVLIALTNRAETTLEREYVYDVPALDVGQLHAAQQANLSTPRWIDREDGIVSIPIDDAIRLVSRELAVSADGTGPWSPRPRKAESDKPPPEQ